MVEVYLKGREKSTMSSYQSSYKRLLGLCERAKVSIFRLNEESRCELWMEASESGLSAASLRGVCAVVSLVSYGNEGGLFGERENPEEVFDKGEKS